MTSIIINHNWQKIDNNLNIFDLDGTLITCRGTFPKSVDDIKFKFDENIIINKLNNENKGIIIITNQYGLKGGKGLSQDQWKQRLKYLTDKLTIPYMVFAALDKDNYRKPETGLYNLFIKDYNGNVAPENVNYIGDALGRNNDFSSSDLKFALNCKMGIMSPEKYFSGIDDEDTYRITGFDPHNPIHYKNTVMPIIKKYPKEMVLMVGSPCCGKTTFVADYFGNYERINQDTLKTKPKCLKMTEKALSDNKNVIIDNTNPSKDVRKEYIDLAKKYGYSIRIYVKETTKELTDHLNMVRYRQNGVRLPDIAFRMFWSKYVEPSLDESENIKEIVKIPFIINKTEEFMKYS